MNSRAILLSGTLLLSLTNLAQNFDGFNYQAVVRNAAGDPLPSQAVGVQVIVVSGILQPHVEIHSVTTDAHGLMKLVIGEGQLQSGPAFSAINWSGNTAWTCCVAVDITGGTNYTSLGCETFKAVPFALRALTSDSGPPTGWSLNGPTLSNTNTGKVGIGTTTPDAKLTIGTPGQTWTDFGITSDSRFGVVNGSGGRLAAILSSSASGGRLESWDYATSTWAPTLISPFGGNVGIGTTTPSAKLEVVGSFKLNDGNQAPGKVLTSDANGNATWSPPSGGTGWALNGTNLYNTNIGNVGLGTTAPVARLDVSGSGWFRADANSLPTSAGKGVRVFYDQTYDVGQIFSHDYSTGTPSNIILQGPGGNVGIGTTTPEHKLDVNGVVRIKDHLTFNSANGVVNWGPSGSLFFRTLNAVGDISGYNDRMVIAANGNVGIGTTAPSANLEVVGSFKINDGNQAAGKVLTSDASGIASWQAMPSITSGTYTPTWVTISGFTTAPTFLGCTYSKVGAIVTVVCSIGGAGPVYSTGTNSATITVPTDLPIANPPGGPRVCGTFSSGYHESGTETSTGFVLRSNTTKVLLKMNGSNYAGIAGTWCSFTYATSAP